MGRPMPARIGRFQVEESIPSLRDSQEEISGPGRNNKTLLDEAIRNRRRTRLAVR